MARKFGSEPTVGLARHIMGEYWQWARHAVYDMRYETMMADGLGEVRRVAAALGLHGADCAGVLAEIDALGSAAAATAEKDGAAGGGGGAYDPSSLMHPGHVTDGRHGSWREQLPANVAEEIEREFGEWMERRGYGRAAVAAAAL
jgi:hypothetical protein